MKIVLVLRGVTMSLYLLLIDIRKWESKHSFRLSLPLSYRDSAVDLTLAKKREAYYVI